MELEGKVVLVTGAAGGIGQATVRAFAAEGARVVVHYHKSAEAAAGLRDEIGENAIALRADLRDEREVNSLFMSAIDHFGRIDAIVANAGIWEADSVPLHEMSLAQWQGTMEADLTSAFLTCRAFMRHLADEPREPASIVMVGSTAAIFGEADHADYAAAKSGMVYGLARSLKNEIVRLAPRGRVNAVCPGWTDTPMAAGGTSDPAAMERVFATMPLKKIATPEDVAHLITFLLSDRLSGHVSGAVVTIAGGMEGRLL